MTTIDKLDIGVHIQYAERTELVRELTQRINLDQAASIPPQIQVVDFLPKLTELDLLLGVTTVLTPWALFLPPRFFRARRRSPFAVSRILPSLGSQEEHEDLYAYVSGLVCNTPEEAREKEAILACFGQMDKINDWLGHILGRIGQFLQG